MAPSLYTLPIDVLIPRLRCVKPVLRAGDGARVYHAAAFYGTTSKRILQILNMRPGKPVRSASSTLSLRDRHFLVNYFGNGDIAS